MESGQRYDTVLLDADNTIFDFSSAERNAILAMMEHWGLPRTEENAALYSRLNDALWQKLNRGEITHAALRTERFRQFAEQTGLRGDPAEMDACYRQELARGSQLLPGAEAFCRTLARRCRLALLTNGSAATQRARFAGAPVTALFGDDIFISEEMGVQKPEPAFFEAVFEKMGRPDRARTVMVGDSLTSDIRGGNRAGIDTIWYCPGGAAARTEEPTYTAETYGEILRIILGGQEKAADPEAGPAAAQ